MGKNNKIKYLIPVSLLGIGLMFYGNNSISKISAQTAETKESKDLLIAEVAISGIQSENETETSKEEEPNHTEDSLMIDTTETIQEQITTAPSKEEIPTSTEEPQSSIAIEPVAPTYETSRPVENSVEVIPTVDQFVSEVPTAEVIENYTFTITRNQTTQEFIEEISFDAQNIAWNNDLYASVMIAQAILETGSGNSTLSRAPNYNLFGIKGSFKGSTVNFSTQEDDGSGKMYTIKSGFRKYPSYKESLEDYAVLLREGISGNADFYRMTWKSNQEGYQGVTAYLTGRYATDTNYAKKLNALIAGYHLTQYDERPDPNVKKKKISHLKQDAAKENKSNGDSVITKIIQQEEYSEWNAGRVLPEQAIDTTKNLDKLKTGSNWQQEPAKKILGTHVIK